MTLLKDTIDTNAKRINPLLAGNYYCVTASRESLDDLASMQLGILRANAIDKSLGELLEAKVQITNFPISRYNDALPTFILDDAMTNVAAWNTRDKGMPTTDLVGTVVIKAKASVETRTWTKAASLEKVISQDAFTRHIFELKSIDCSADNRPAIRKIYEKIEEYLKKDEFTKINQYIDIFLKNKFSLTLHTSLLIATNRRKSKITDRWKLYDRARELAIQKCESKGVPSDQIESDVNQLLLELK